jgi:hypothetical protein
MSRILFAAGVLGIFATMLTAAELPDPFVFADGRRVKTAQDWRARRAELRAQILKIEYGELPPAPRSVKVVPLVKQTQQRTTKLPHRQYKVYCEIEGNRPRIEFVLDIILPKGDGPFPVIVRGDWGWFKTPDAITLAVVERGYALVDFNRLEFAADRTKEEVGLNAAYPEGTFGAVAAWAWGYHRAVDALSTLPFIDKEKIAITGHSRGGKAVLLAGATDERIALTNPNNSGCGGAGCYRFEGPESETLEMITRSFPTWFTPSFRDFAGKESELPFDQHSVKALVAPRALLSTEALGDLHANPSGSLQTHRAAREVYKFLGQPDRVAIAFRPGPHEHNAGDWNTLLDFADEVFFKKKSSRDWNADPFGDLPSAFSWCAPAPE